MFLHAGIKRKHHFVDCWCVRWCDQGVLKVNCTVYDPILCVSCTCGRICISTRPAAGFMLLRWLKHRKHRARNMDVNEAGFKIFQKNQLLKRLCSLILFKFVYNKTPQSSFTGLPWSDLWLSLHVLWKQILQLHFHSHCSYIRVNVTFPWCAVVWIFFSLTGSMVSVISAPKRDPALISGCDTAVKLSSHSLTTVIISFLTMQWKWDMFMCCVFF